MFRVKPDIILEGDSRIKSIGLHRKWPPSGQTLDAPVFPKDLIAHLPTAESIGTEGFQRPTAIEMNSLEYACLMADRGSIPYDTVMTLTEKVIQDQGKEHRDSRSFCITKVECEIHEVLLPTP